MLRTLYIIGAGGHGAVVLEAAQSCRQWERFVFLDSDTALHGQAVLGAPVHGVEALPTPGPDVAVFVAIGLNNASRAQLVHEYLHQGYEVPVIIHARAHLAAQTQLHPGSVLMAQSAVNPRAVLGHACIVNTGATVEHDCELADGVHVSPGAALCGGVKVGANTHIGAGAAVRQNITIGADCVVGMGAAVVDDMADACLGVGVPARVSALERKTKP